MERTRITGMESGECIETGKKCGGMKGLARNPQTAAKVLEEFLSTAVVNT